MLNIIEKVLAKKAESIKRMPCKSNRASGIGYFVPELEGCLRRGVYERTHWQEKEMHDARVQLIFDEGHNQEQIVLRDLAEAGVCVIEQQSAFEWPEYEITGHLDGVLIDECGAVPLEIKSMAPHIFAVINQFDDFKKKPWTRAYMAQMTLYMLMKNIDHGIFILKNKSTGELKQVDCLLDYDLGEYCIRAAERINAHIKTGTLPDQITDREKCKACPYKLTCLPSVNFGEELKIEDDPMLERRIKRYLNLKPQSDECAEEYEIIKGRAKATAGDGALNMMVGPYLLKGKKDARGAFRFEIGTV